MSSSVLATKRPAGAGRIDDFTWPNPRSQSNGDTNVSPRNGVSASEAQTVGIGGGSGCNALQYAGADCQQIWANATVGYGFGFNGLATQQRNQRLAGSSGLADDRAVTRLYAVMATAAAIPVNDCGLQVILAGDIANNILRNGKNGYGFQFLTANVVQFIVRGPNGLKTYNLTAAPFDCTAWHTYELRYYKATATQDAKLDVLIDGVSVASKIAATSLSFAAGTDLPTIASASNQYKIMPALLCAPGVLNAALYVHELRVIAAPTLADCL